MKKEILLNKTINGVSLEKFTTFKIGGKVKYFFVAKNKQSLIKAVLWAEEASLPFFILGGGSNLLVADRGFRGLVIKNENNKHETNGKKISAEAGVPLSSLLKEATKNNLAGLEWSAGIPGTVGGALFGNAGAFGKSMKDSVQGVKIFDVKSRKIKILKKKDCGFSYRESIFKKNKDLVIISAAFSFKKGKSETINKKIKEYLDYRKEHQPLNFPSAGSVFKNSKNLSAGDLIEKCGLMGKKIGNAEISQKHANFIVNLGKATSKDVMGLVNLAKKSVKNKFGVALEEEIQYLPPKISKK